MDPDLRQSILQTLARETPARFWADLSRRHTVIYDEIDESLKEVHHYTDKERFYRRGHDVRCEIECALRQAAQQARLGWRDKPYTSENGLTNGLTHVEVESDHFRISQQKVDSRGSLPRASDSRKQDAEKNATLSSQRLLDFKGLPGAQLKLFGPKDIIQVWILRNRRGAGSRGDEPMLRIGLPHESEAEKYHAIYDLEELHFAYRALESAQSPEPVLKPTLIKKEQE